VNIIRSIRPQQQTSFIAKLIITAFLIPLSIIILVSPSSAFVNAQNQTNNGNNTNSNTSTTTTITSSNTSSMSAPSTTTPTSNNTNNRTFYLFTAEHQGLNETRLGIPADTFSPDVLVATEGDNITIHFYNLDTTARHTFTIDSPPYTINKDLLPGQNATVTFKATQEGIFRFYCTYHLPTMAGQLIVLHPPTVEKIGAATIR
jgi:plastocyanin